MRRARASTASAAALACLAGCVGADLPPPAPPKGSLHALGARGTEDPTVKGSHLVPEHIDEEKNFGAEPGGGVRTVVLGMRIVTLPNGAVLSAPDRLPQLLQSTVALPDRLGGGFLFQLGQVVWYAPKWLARAKPIFQSLTGISRLVVGLDRVYVRGNGQNPAHQAFDPRTGARLDLGPWPGSPFVGAYVAADAWRAVAITDWRGAVATFDAGATWRSLGLPIDAREVVLLGDRDSIAVGGQDAGKQAAWYEVRPDGQVGKLAGPPPATSQSRVQVTATPLEQAARRFGKHPLLAAIEDGWPLSDGTAVIARDGALARVRLSDGALVEAVDDAYLLSPSRCHPIAMSRPKDPGAFGFVCGESRGKTVIYKYDPAAGRLAELRRFDQPRAVISSGNGAIAVRGACAADAPPDDADRKQQSYCLFARDDQWREIRVRGDIGGERVVVMSDGRIAVVSPPHGDLTTARLTLLDKGRATTVPIVFPSIAHDVARVLKHGVWMDGFEERAPGVLGGWVEAGGATLGVQITLDGHIKHGKFVRDAGSPMVSGRYGLGFTGVKRGYETIDGGMTWTEIEIPEPAVSEPRKIVERACGPVGCTAAGWLRIGWGPSTNGSKLEPPPVPRTPYRAATVLEVDCEPLGGAPPDPPKPPGRASPAPVVVPAPHRSPYYGAYGPQTSQGLSELPPFYTHAGPVVKTEELGLVLDVSERGTYPYAGYSPSTGPSSMKLYTWGPKTGDWDRSGKWMARWLWPYGGWADAQATQGAPAPFANLDAARRVVAGYVPGWVPTAWQVAFGDDARHALLLGKRQNVSPPETHVIAMETDRAPVEIKRVDGEPLADIDGVVRAAGRWYVATSQALHELPATVVWVIEGSIAREIARVPRGAFESRPGVRLARRNDARAIGIVVEGQPSAERPGSALRWVLPIDLESAAPGDPELLGPRDFADRPLVACGAPAPGWVLDAPLDAGARVRLSSGQYNVQSPMARLRLTRDAACVEMLGGNIDPSYGAPMTDALVRAKPLEKTDKPTIAAGIWSLRSRYPLRCSSRAP